MLLGSIGRSQALADAIRGIAGSKELDKTRFRETLLEQELGGLRCIGYIRLGGSLVTRVSQQIIQWINLPFRGRWRGFTLSTLVFSSKTHQRAILCLHYSSLLFQLSYYYCVLLNMAQSSYFVYLLAFTLFCTQYKLE